MKLLHTLCLVLTFAVASHALGDKTQFDTTPPPPVPNPRMASPIVLGMEIGVNSMASLVGARLTWYPVQQLALDIGGGWSAAGMRGGVGARYFLWKTFNSPFVGVAWMRSGGVDSANLDDGDQSWNETQIKNLQFVNAIIGYEWRNADGLVAAVSTGWSQCTTIEKKDRYKIHGGNLSSDAKDNLDLFIGSGPILAFNVGYGF